MNLEGFLELLRNRSVRPVQACVIITCIRSEEAHKENPSVWGERIQLEESIDTDEFEIVSYEGEEQSENAPKDLDRAILNKMMLVWREERTVKREKLREEQRDDDF